MNSHTHAIAIPPLVRPANAATLRSLIGRAVASWLQRSRDRHELANLCERQRRDMGLERDAIDAEIAKPFWRA